MKSVLTAAGLLSFCLACAATAKPQLPTEDLLGLMIEGNSAVQGKELEEAIRSADAFPLGHAKNPVRVSQPSGERGYLNRLRCSDGNPPAYERLGSTGDSPYGNIMDIYAVRCEGSAPADSQVFMDMYHKGFSEPRPVPGFTTAQ